MIWLVRLYPAAWRQRYGEEFASILATQPMTTALFLDVLSGALDARLHPQLWAKSSPNTSELTEGDSMTIAMMKRCLVGGPSSSRQDRKSARTATIIASLATALIYLALTKVYRDAPAVQAFGLASYPAVVLFYEQMARLRQRPLLTRYLLVSGMVLLMYLFLWGICLLPRAF